MVQQAVLKINFTRHAGQAEVLAGVLESDATVICCAASRGWGKCVKDDLPLYLASGKKVLAKDLVGKEFKLLTLNEKGEQVVAEAKAFGNGEKEVFKLKTTAGRTIEATANHPLFVATGWKTISELRAGDRVAISMARRFGRARPDLNWVKILAYIIGDGGLTTGNVIFTKMNNIHTDDFNAACGALGYDVKHRENIHHRPTRKSKKSMTMQDRFREVGLMGKSSRDKFIPDEVFEYTEEALALFLNRLFSTDGWAHQEKSGSSEIGYSSTSEKLVSQIADLLSRFGIFATVNSRTGSLKGKIFHSFTLSIHDNDEIKKFVSQIGIFGKEEQISKLRLRELKTGGSKYRSLPKHVRDYIIENHSIGVKMRKACGHLSNSSAPTRDKVRKYAEYLDSDVLLAMVKAPLVYDEVKSIESIGIQKTVSIEVPKYHNYLNTFFEHNTVWTTCDIVAPLMAQNPDSQIMWVAPTYKIAKAPIDDVWFGRDERTGLNYIPQFDEKTGIQFWDYKRGDMELHLLNGSKMYLRSADNPTGIVAKGFNLIVIDEAAQISKQIFMQYILPTARRQGCKIVLITTPRGKNWIYEMYLAGQDPSKKDYFSTRQPWHKRPNYPELLVRLMKDMPDHLRKQEFEADFISDSSSIFKNLDVVFTGKQIEFSGGEQEWEIPVSSDDEFEDTRILAVDLAKQSDYTVITVFGVNNKKLYYYARFNKTDYKVVLERIKRTAKKFNADVIYDATGVGMGVGDFLSSELNVIPFVFTNQSKNQIINKLAIACEYGELKLPNIATIREEFELFTYTINKTGTLSYSAPDGKHDDIVCSMAMALWYISENAGSANVESVDDFLSVVDSIRQPRSRLQQLMDEDD